MAPSIRRPSRAVARFALAVIATSVVAAACGNDGGDTAASDPDAGASAAASELVDALRRLDLESAATAVEVAGLDLLDDGQEYTMFVPTDDAFASLGADEIAELFAQPEQLGELLRDHVVVGRTSAAELAGLDDVATDGGHRLEIGDGGATVDGAAIVEADIAVGPGGIVHVIDRVLGE